MLIYSSSNKTASCSEGQPTQETSNYQMGEEFHEENLTWIRKNFCAVLLCVFVFVFVCICICIQPEWEKTSARFFCPRRSAWFAPFSCAQPLFCHFNSWSLSQNDLVPPESVLVELGEAVDHDGDGEGEDEDAAEGAELQNCKIAKLQNCKITKLQNCKIDNLGLKIEKSLTC